MDVLLRSVATYTFLLVLFRLMGKRTFSDLSPFNFILLLIVSEATQNALVGDDHSVTTGLIVILTLMMLDRGLTILKARSRAIEIWTEGLPLVIVDHGRVLQESASKSHVTINDILQSARQSHGIGELEKIKYAVLEPTGGISIVPMEKDGEAELERRIEQALERVLDRRRENAE